MGRTVLVVVAVLAFWVPSSPMSAASAASSRCANATADLYVNVSAKHSKHATGLNTSRCAFSSITDAIANARARGLGGDARIILTGGTDATPAVLDRESFPLVPPAGLTITTTDDPALGGGGLVASHYVVSFSGTADYAMLLSAAGLAGITLQNGTATTASDMLLCTAAGARMDTVVLDGTAPGGAAIPTGMELRSGCTLDAATIRVRHFGGDGVVVAPGADLTLRREATPGTRQPNKIYNNGGTGLVVRGTASIGNAEIAFNTHDGVLVDASTAATFFGNDVRDNGESGFEVHSSTASFPGGNTIHNNGRTSGGWWVAPQMYFIGPPLSGVQVYNPDLSRYQTAYPFQGAGAPCDWHNTNAIWSYQRRTGITPVRVAILVQDGAVVDATNDRFMSYDVSEGWDWTAIGNDSYVSFIGTSHDASDVTLCHPRVPGFDPDPPAPVQ